MFKTILIPLDGSLRAELVLEYLLPLLRERKPEVILSRAVYESSDEKALTDYQKILGEDLVTAEAYLANVKAKLTLDGVRARTQVYQGRPPEAILAGARREGADLIAMTTHGRTGLERLLMGSVAESILRASEIPVLAVRAFSPRIFSGRANPFGRILFPVEAGDLAESILPFVRSFARSFRSEVILAHVDADARVSVGAFYGSLIGPGAPPPSEAAVAPEAVDRVGKSLAEAGLAVGSVAVTGDAAGKIVDLAISREADLIVMATHGRTGLPRWIKGSVTEQVLRASPIPLLVMRPKKA